MMRAAAAAGAVRLAALLLCLAWGVASAERGDRDKPMQLEANRMTSDEVRRISIFEGNVSLTKGTMTIKAERIVVHQDADGYQIATATGRPVRFRQKGDPRGDRQAVWTEGEAMRVEVDDRNERIEMFERARVMRDQDEVRGEYIVLDQRSEFFSASTAKGAPAATTEGRVRAVIQPKSPAASAPPASPGPPAERPPVR